MILADDAVLFELVWGGEFPANREKTREISVFRPLPGETAHNNIFNSRGCERIP